MTKWEREVEGDRPCMHACSESCMVSYFLLRLGTSLWASQWKRWNFEKNKSVVRNKQREQYTIQLWIAPARGGVEIQRESARAKQALLAITILWTSLSLFLLIIIAKNIFVSDASCWHELVNLSSFLIPWTYPPMSTLSCSQTNTFPSLFTFNTLYFKILLWPPLLPLSLISPPSLSKHRMEEHRPVSIHYRSCPLV